MFGLTSKHAYGLQIHESGIKLAGMKQTKQGLLLHTLEQVEFDHPVLRNGKVIDEQTILTALVTLKNSHSLAKSDVHLAISSTNTLIRRTKVASLSHSEMRNLIDLELHSGDKLPFKNPVFDFVRIANMQTDEQSLHMSQTDGNDFVTQEEVLIFATPEDVIEQYLSVFKKAELQIVSIDLAPLCLFRMLVHPTNEERTELPDLFMTIEHIAEHVDVAIFYHGLPVFMRSITISGSSKFESEEERREQFHKSLSMELSRIINYYKFSISSEFHDIATVYFSGAQSLGQIMVDSLSKELNLEVHFIDSPIFHTYDTNQLETVDIGLFCTAIGLALKGLKG